jgi:DNA gyrase subunit A
LRDECDENTRIVLELKRDARPQVVINNLFKMTALESTFSVNMLAIDNRRPRLLNIKDAIACYIEHRREVVLRRTKYLLGKAEERAEILEALLLASGNIDDFIQTIRASKDRAEAEVKIKAYPFTTAAAEALGVIIRGQPQVRGDSYVFSDRQVKAIVELQLYKLTSLERQKVKDEYDEVLAEIKDLLDIIGSESRVLTIIKDELRTLKEKYATPRKTVLMEAEGELQTVDLIANDGQIITISHRGYIKRTASVAYRLQSRGGKGLKGMETRAAQSDEEESDFVEHLFSATAHDYLMFFTNTGRVFTERVFQIPEGDRTSKGRSIKNLLNLRPEEKIASVLRLVCVGQEDKDTTFDPNKFVIFATRNGTVKRTNLGEFRNIRKDGIIAINIAEGDVLIGCELTNGRDEVVLVTHEGMSLRFKEYSEKVTAKEGEPAAEGDESVAEDSSAEAAEIVEGDGAEASESGEGKEKGGIRDMGRNATGVRGIRLDKGDYVVSLVTVSTTGTLLVASEKGIGKRSSFDEYRIQTRGGKGIITMKTTDKTGNVARALVVQETDELMLMTSSGQSVRIPVVQIREAGRNTQGVKLITLREGELIQDVAKVVAEKDETEEGESTPAEGTIPEAPSENGDSPATDTDTPES